MPQDVLFHPLEGPSLPVSATWGLPGTLASFPGTAKQGRQAGKETMPHTTSPDTVPARKG